MSHSHHSLGSFNPPSSRAMSWSCRDRHSAESASFLYSIGPAHLTMAGLGSASRGLGLRRFFATQSSTTQRRVHSGGGGAGVLMGFSVITRGGSLRPLASYKFD